MAGSKLRTVPYVPPSVPQNTHNVCSLMPNNTARRPDFGLVLGSPLPKGIYDEDADTQSEAIYNRRQYISSSMSLGHVSDLRPIYQHASDAIAFSFIGQNKSRQSIFTNIFGEQEHARSRSIPTSPWRSWLSSAISNTQNPSAKGGPFSNDTFIQGRKYDFGIGLDYGL